MDSIYHIETDIECKVLHYGKEVCIAIPGQDSSIELRKGRHKLTFISTENPIDQYSIMYEVPENDIEDFIEVELKPIRDKRLADEAEARRIAYEAEQKRIREAKEREEEELKRMQEEERKRREEEERKRKQEEEQLALKQKEECKRLRFQRLSQIFQEAKEYDEMFWGSWPEDYSLFPTNDGAYQNQYKQRVFEHPYVNWPDQSNYACHNQLKINSRIHNRFQEGLACVTLISGGQAFTPSGRMACPIYRIGYIDSKGGIAIPFNYYCGTPFSMDRAFVLKKTASQYREVTFCSGEIWSWSIEKIDEMPDMHFVSYDSNNDAFTVKIPIFDNSKWLLIDRKNNVLAELPDRDGFSPSFNPFSQGLSVILWRPNEGVSSRGVIDVIDRQGNIIMQYDNLPYDLPKEYYCPVVFKNGYAVIHFRERLVPRALENNLVLSVFDEYVGYYRSSIDTDLLVHSKV